jgi:hypothetical protein
MPDTANTTSMTVTNANVVAITSAATLPDGWTTEVKPLDSLVGIDTTTELFAEEPVIRAFLEAEGFDNVQEEDFDISTLEAGQSLVVITLQDPDQAEEWTSDQEVPDADEFKFGLITRLS